MPRIVGIDIPPNKRIIISLTYVFGIGKYLSKQILEALDLDPNKRAKDLTSDEIAQLNNLLQSEKYIIEGDLKRKVQGDIKRLIAINAYRGQRHRLGLPVRGQRTRSNARTRKGRKKTVANKKQ